MSAVVQAIRGMNDLLPDDTSMWQQVEKVLRETVQAYGYQEMRMPIVEKTNLFSRAIGEVTDVVEKEMYSFIDRSGDDLSLRPEGTAGCVRACIEHNLIVNQEQRLWYMGPMFRHERPQKGRYRQFHQMGVEVFGLEGPDVDAEIIAMSHSIFKKLGIADDLQLQINTLGNSQERALYREKLVKYLEDHFEELDEDSKRRTHTNPLRVLDSKDENVQRLLVNAPKLSECLGAETTAHFSRLLQMLSALGIKYVINEKLVRGLDYYNLTVFEWVTTALGAQGTVCGGGRYDTLVELLGGKPTKAVGFGLGLERLMLLLTTLNKISIRPHVDVYVVGSGENIDLKMLQLADNLREQLPQYRIMAHCGGGNFKKQFKKADRLGAKVAVILGENEIANHTVTLKDLLNQDAPQQECPETQVVAMLNMLLKDK
jgi:histidyl-tRNA synthetase